MAGRFSYSTPERGHSTPWFKVGDFDVTTTVLVAATCVVSMFVWAIDRSLLEPLVLYADDAGTLTLLDTTTITEEVLSGTSLDTYEVQMTLADFGSDGLIAIIDEGNSISECSEDNNQGLWEDPPC